MSAWVKAAALLVAVAGCAQQAPVLRPALDADPDAAPVELVDTAFHPQERYQCGPAALATVLDASGVGVRPEDLVGQVYIPERRGSLQTEMVAATRRHGRIPYLTAPSLGALLAEIDAGRPVLVFQNLGLDTLPVWHYAVVVGYSPDEDTLVLRSGTERRRVVQAREFMRTWDGGGRWAMVTLEPGELPAQPDRTRYLEAVAAVEEVTGAGVLLPAYTAALARWPDDPTALFGSGNAHYERGDLSGAEKAFRQALHVQPGNPAAANNLAGVLAARGCLEEALDIVDTALSHGGRGGEVERALLLTRQEILAAKPAARSPAAACGPGEGSAQR